MVFLMKTLAIAIVTSQADRCFTISQVLRSFPFNDDETEWADKLPYVELAINANVNGSTQKPAFELLYGENVALPIEKALGTSD